MFQLRLVAGGDPGREFNVGKFPFRIGRSSRADLCISAAGIWDQHCELLLPSAAGCLLRPVSEALTVVNGQPIDGETVLRNGDLIELGPLKLRFWLSPVRQKGFRAREWLVWTGIAVVTAAQIALIYWLLR